jgi:CubicO group peptidase (beta-lactamase class C family)
VNASSASLGNVDERFEPVRKLFDAYLQEDPDFSAQLSVHWRDRHVVDLAGGKLGTGSVTGVYSVSKAVSALVIATLIDSGQLDPDAAVAEYWPEFAANGKATVSVRQLLSHQAGLAALAGVVPLADILEDSSAAAARLAQQHPIWRPGSAFGYHALTIGVLMEELVRRITASTLQGLYEARIRTPRHADFYLGLPASEDGRYVPIGDAIVTDAQRAEADSRPPADALHELVFDNVVASIGTGEDGITPNNPRVRRWGPAAIGGVGSARGLSRLFADTLASSQQPIASGATFAAMAQQHSWGVDRVLNATNAFGLIFMLPQPRLPFAGIGSFGHDGAGGALAFADPMSQLAFGYIPHPMQYPGGADHRSVALARMAAAVVRSSH